MMVKIKFLLLLHRMFNPVKTNRAIHIEPSIRAAE